MHRASLRARLRARLDADERGFTIIETVIAITVIFGVLIAMAYTATAGFTTIAYGRERIQTTGLANKIMEEVRGQAYSKIKQGIKSTELTTGDPRIVFCTSDGSYHFESCTSANGSGEKIVSTAGLAATPWLVPHTGAVSVGNLTATYATYVTNDNTTSNAYRVTVIVDWVSRARPNAPNNTVRIQSLFWSPSGCVSEETHPFAAPCQPFFYGQASVPQGQVSIAGQIHAHSVSWEQSVLKFTGVEADLQQEQVSELQSTFTQSGVTMTAAGNLQSSGGTTTTSSAADTDPAGTTSTYASNSATGASDTLSVRQTDSYTATSNEIGLSVFTPANDAGMAQAAVQATATNVCPPPGDTGEIDNLPCAGARVQMGSSGGPATAKSLFSHAVGSTALGSATIVSVTPTSSNPNKALVDREAVSGQDGRVEMTSTRRLGTINIGGMPSGMAGPAGWTGASPYGGYCVTLDAYQDTTTAQAGTSTSAPTATVNSGRMYYYNGSGFSNKAATDSDLSAQAVTCTHTQTINSKVVVWTVAVSAGGLEPATVSTSSTAGSVSTTRTDVESSVVAPTIVARYTVSIAGVTEVDYTVTLDLGINRSRGVYGPPPAPV